MPDVFAQGMLGMAWLGRLLTNWAPQAQLRSFDVRFAGITHLGNAIRCTGQVVEKLDHNGERCVRVEIPSTNQFGQLKIVGDSPGRPALSAFQRKFRMTAQTRRQGRAGHRIRPRHRPRHRAQARRAKAPASSSTTWTRRRRRRRSPTSRRWAARRWPASATSPRPTSPSASSARRSTTYKGLDIIVNNAGYTWDNVIQKMTDEQWYAIIDCHLTAPFRILRAAQPVIRGLDQGRGQEAGRRVVRKVVNISSVAGLFGNAGQTNYSTAKAGIVGMTQTLAKEWGRMNVTVNCVAYGFIKTRLTVVAGDGETHRPHRRPRHQGRRQSRI